jgi:hypothetical protein
MMVIHSTLFYVQCLFLYKRARMYTLIFKYPVYVYVIRVNAMNTYTKVGV